MLTERILKNHVAFRKKLLLGKKDFSRKDILLETILRVLVFPIFAELSFAVINELRGGVSDFRPIRFWGISIGLSVITPIQLILVNWKIHRDSNKSH